MNNTSDKSKLNNQISQQDAYFIMRRLLPHFGIPKIGIAFSESAKTYPDIWVQYKRTNPNNTSAIPVITVTREWARQDMHERRKRLVHEFLHLVGLEHDDKIKYSTFPDKDNFSMRYYNTYFRNHK